MGFGAFSDCYNLQEINIGKGLKNLGYDSFCNCTNLRHVDIPSNVDYVGYRSFADCTNLESISLDGHTQIDPGAFVNCPSLTTIEISLLRNNILISIAAIARVEMISKKENTETAHKIVVEGGKTITCDAPIHQIPVFKKK